MTKVTISMPLFIKLAKKATGKKYHINLNNYRNWNFNASNKLKENYKNIAVEKLENAPTIRAEKVTIIYELFRGDKRKFDLMNILSIHDKFFSDALVWLGCLPDDNIKHLDELIFKYGGIDKENPRVDITIITIKKQ